MSISLIQGEPEEEMFMKRLLFTNLVLMVVFCVLVISGMPAFAQTRPRTENNLAVRKIVPQPRNTVNVDIGFDKQCGASYRQGEKIVISFKTDVDAYVTIYDIDTRGEVSVLFPNREVPNNYVRANRTYTLPDRTYSYDLVVEGPEGIEYVDIVASTDPYYQWDYSRGEPRWLYDWGLRGRQERDVRGLSSGSYKQSQEYQQRPEQFSEIGKQSILENYATSRQLREQIREKIVVQPREEEQNYATATCYFYVTNSYSQAPPPQPTQAPPSSTWDTYLRQQERELQQIPGFDVNRSGDRLIVSIPNNLNGRTYLFDFDSYEVRYQARQDLNLVADILRRYPETYVTVAGHTDSIGDANYNQRLSEYRAQAVANHLISRGLQTYRVSYVGYGETMPIASNATESGRQRNRRVEIYLTASPYYTR
jgi:outer membrane protein OmpA-like peptidoglycan-associated protein